MSGTDRWLTAQTDRGLSELGAATDFTLGKTVPPVPIGNTSIIQYTFGPGNLGIALDEAQGGKRVVISGTSREDLNGRVEVVQNFDASKGRYVVQLEGGEGEQVNSRPVQKR